MAEVNTNVYYSSGTSVYDYANISGDSSIVNRPYELTVDTTVAIPSVIAYSSIGDCCKEMNQKPPEKKKEKPDPPNQPEKKTFGVAQYIKDLPMPGVRQEALTPEKILFKPPATIVFWKDGSKTVVKCMEGEHFNEYFGFLAALGKKIFGTNSELNRIVKRGQFQKAFRVSEKPTPKTPAKKKPASNSKTNKKGAKK